jgi:hypothetical protein
MIGFRVRINGRKFATAALPGHHVVHAIATSVVRRPEVVRAARPRKVEPRDLKFELGGMWTTPSGIEEYVSWTNNLALTPGDKISIEVVDTESVDRPRHRSITAAPTLEAAEKKQFRQLIKKYGKATATAAGGRHKKALQTDGGSRRR